MPTIFKGTPFHRITVRSFVLWYLVSVPIVMAIELLASALTNRAPTDSLVTDIAACSWTYGFILVWALWQCGRTRISIRQLFGGLPSRDQFLPTIGVVIPLILFALGLFWLVYHPLSFILPGFVSQIFYAQTHPALEILFTVMIGPPIEELLFRGLLLHKWGSELGVHRAVLLSSLVFGILTLEVLSGFVLGFVMAVLYINTRKLTIPIACRMLGNGIGITLANVFPSVVTVDLAHQSQSDVWLGVFFLILSTPWVIYFMYKHWPSQRQCLPYFVREE